MQRRQNGVRHHFRKVGAATVQGHFQQVIIDGAHPQRAGFLRAVNDIGGVYNAGQFNKP